MRGFRRIGGNLISVVFMSQRPIFGSLMGATPSRSAGCTAALTLTDLLKRHLHYDIAIKSLTEYHLRLLIRTIRQCFMTLPLLAVSRRSDRSLEAR
jgi:hypothetical protein